MRTRRSFSQPPPSPLPLKPSNLTLAAAILAGVGEEGRGLHFQFPPLMAQKGGGKSTSNVREYPNNTKGSRRGWKTLLCFFLVRCMSLLQTKEGGTPVATSTVWPNCRSGGTRRCPEGTKQNITPLPSSPVHEFSFMLPGSVSRRHTHTHTRAASLCASFILGYIFAISPQQHARAHTHTHIHAHTRVQTRGCTSDFLQRLLFLCLRRLIIFMSAASVIATGSRTALPKDALCYQCALRMSMLFDYPPPRAIGQLQTSLTSGTISALHDDTLPTLDDDHHPLFTLIHETPQSARRYFHCSLQATVTMAKGLEAPLPVGEPEVMRTTAAASTAHGMLGGDTSPKYAVSWLCVACMGLYQFIDLIHAPLAAAAVRASPFYDSEAITINVNINRSFTFTWLAVATRYFDIKGTGTERPLPSSIVKEELSNFKDFYMSDLRARILPYLLYSHDDVAASSVSPASISRTTPLPGLAVYVDAVGAMLSYHARETEKETTASEPVAKNARTETAALASGLGSSSSAALGAGATRPALVALQAFHYSGASEGLVGEVFCRHHATEGLITDGHMPAAYCGNRSTEVLPYSVIYDYAVPYLTKAGWMPVAPTAAGAEDQEDRRATARQAATVSCRVHHTNIYLMGSYRKMMRNMSQSPWFLNGQRIGSFSLQEVIANPLLPFFFPDMPARPPDAAVLPALPASDEEKSTLAALPAVERGTHATRWQAVAPSAASSTLVFGYNRYKFHSAGREDVDVRMLGEGRPFVLELISPIRERFTEDDLRRLEASICSSYEGSVEVRQLRRTDADITVRLARHSESKVKRYCCVIWSSRAIDDVATDPHVRTIHAMKDLHIQQKTPLRVLHRRSLHRRPRLIHSMRLTPLNTHWFLLDLETQAGTYVKEFVHGDMGRTTPHLGMLLNARTDIIQLDVVGMAMHDLDQE
ncbi:hypothetical protein, conserved [Leishmania tarentolae]|uniref:tRNA pseudouridine(55) synthase n=1 Tax=Leishmania tarentolae TaxID=5689 RepID=A0A640KCA5_LEITA|nr:hypothetical protein, conserved [Leishmania tarentolae]